MNPLGLYRFIYIQMERAVTLRGHPLKTNRPFLYLWISFSLTVQENNQTGLNKVDLIVFNSQEARSIEDLISFSLFGLAFEYKHPRFPHSLSHKHIMSHSHPLHCHCAQRFVS